MRRSQRLAEKNSISYAELNGGSFSTSFNQTTEISIQTQKGNGDNGSAENKVYLPHLPVETDVNSNQRKISSISTLSNNLENQDDKANKVIRMDNNSNTQPIDSKLKHQSRRGRKPTKRVRNSTNNQPSKRRRTAGTSNKKIEAPIISIDHYLNPLRHPLLQAETKAQLTENNDLNRYNKIPNMHLKSHNDSLLPPIYPMHFVNQNFANTSNHQPTPAQVLPIPMRDTNIQQQNNPYPTPELSQTLDFESSTSTLSLPESLREVFGCEDIREVLKMDKIIFRMRILHLQALAFVLNIQYEYLCALVEKIMQLDTDTLHKIVYGFKPVMDTINCKTENKEE